jgi:hypothetical protein
VLDDATGSTIVGTADGMAGGAADRTVDRVAIVHSIHSGSTVEARLTVMVTAWRTVQQMAMLPERPTAWLTARLKEGR